MFCTNCGIEVDPDDNFCVKCGQQTLNSVSVIVTDNEQQPANACSSNGSSSFEWDVQTFVDDNYSFYTSKWQQMDETGKSNTLNFASFFFSIPWLGYRKLYHPVLVIALLFLTVDVFLYLSGYQYSLDGFYDPAGYGTEIVLIIVMGMYGNYYYRRNVVKQVTRIRKSEVSPKTKQMELKRKGGTSISGIFLAVGIMAAVYIIPSMVIVPTNVDPVDEVKYGEFEDYPSYTIDDVFSEVFNNGTWKKISGDKHSVIVAYDGEKQMNGEQHDVQIQFLKERDDEVLSIEKIVVDDEELSMLEEEDFLNYIFHGISVPDDGYSDDYI